LRQVDTARLEGLLAQLFIRAALSATNSCACNANVAPSAQRALGQMQAAVVNHPSLLDTALWHKALDEIAGRDSVNALLTGTAAALLMSAGQWSDGQLDAHMRRNLSPGADTDRAAAWFEGFAAYNRYALLSRLSVWRMLDEMIGSLDDAAFLRVLVVLRRTFAAFSAAEKRDVCAKLGALWRAGGEVVEASPARALTEEEKQSLRALDAFVFEGF